MEIKTYLPSLVHFGFFQLFPELFKPTIFIYADDLIYFKNNSQKKISERYNVWKFIKVIDNITKRSIRNSFAVSL